MQLVPPFMTARSCCRTYVTQIGAQRPSAKALSHLAKYLGSLCAALLWDAPQPCLRIALMYSYNEGLMHEHNITMYACLQKMRGREEEMAWQDKKQRLTNEAKNALEAYIYDFRNKLSDQLADFVTDDHKGNLTVKLEQTEVGALALSSRLVVRANCSCMGKLCGVTCGQSMGC